MNKIYSVSFAPANSDDVHGLYLHVPFCFHKCHYCDFYSLVDSAKEDRREPFVHALIAELEKKIQTHPLKLASIFFGGGTPSLLTPSQWGKILSAFEKMGLLHENVEFTIEANPETVTDALAQVWVDGGVNRISLGAQSFHQQHLKTLERHHDPKNVTKAVECLRRAGIQNLNLDLIYAIPHQSMEDLDHDICALLEHTPEHLACYSLIYEPNTPLTVKMKQGRIERIPEDLEAQMFLHVTDRLIAAGYDHYEVSNFARTTTPDATPRTVSPYRCVHNLLYWINANWLGIGPSAASHLNGRRWKNEPHLGHYLRDAPNPKEVDVEMLAQPQRIGEALMMRIRLIDGIEHRWLEDTLPPNDPRWEQLETFIAQALLVREEDRLRLTRRGLLVADAIAERLL